MMLRKIAPVLLLGSLLLAACSPQAAQGAGTAAAAATQQPERHAQSGLEIVPLAITQDGKTHTFAVEVARTPQEQAKGLMFRTQMGQDEGMIFPFDPPKQASFWMKNTVIPLDMLFIGPDGKIINISANTVPYSLESHLAQGLAGAVLELNGGRAAELGITPGAQVQW